MNLSAIASTALLGLLSLGSTVDQTQWSDLTTWPRTTGESLQGFSLVIPGAGSAILIRDATGSPHVSAATEAGGYAGLCWAMAEDRLFQMDLLRRSAQGRLAELFGAGVLEQDRLSRALDLPRIATDRLAQASSHTRRILTACANGISWYIANAIDKDALPLEFRELGYAPEPWTAMHSALLLVYLNASFDMAVWQPKLQMSAIAAAVGVDIMNSLIPGVPDSPSLFDAAGRLNPLGPSASLPAPSGARAARRPVTVSAEAGVPFDLPEHLMGLVSKGWRASNNFAVDGALTASGKPIVASDPHLQLAMPSLVYQASLDVRGIVEVAGFLFSGVPAFVIGHNQNVAWSVSATGLDATDLYVETVANDLVMFNSRWVPLGHRTEVFSVAGGAPVTVNIRDTPHGPVLNDALPSLEPFGTLALRSGNASPEWRFDGFFDMAAARNWDGFQAAARNIGFGFNYIFADRCGPHGHIGFQLAALAPQRAFANTSGPVPGNDGSHEWTRFARFDELPSVYDPPSHLLAAANNRIVPDDYAPKGQPVYITTAWDEPWRAQRAIRRLQTVGHAITVADFESIQLDTTTTVGPPLATQVLNALSRAGLPDVGSRERRAYETLAAWNHDAAATSLGATIYETLTTLLQRDSALAVLGPELYAGYSTTWFATQLHSLLDVLDTPRAPFFGATSAVDAASKRDAAVARALSESVRLLGETLGPDMSRWKWGALHTLTYNHPLAERDPRFALPSYPTAGDVGTLDTGGWFTKVGILGLPPDQLEQAGGARAAFAQDGLAAARAIMNLADFDDSRWVLSTGVSGDPSSPHWADQIKLWHSGKYVTVPY